MSESSRFDFRAFWLPGSVALAAAILLSLADDSNLASLGFTVGSIAIISCIVGVRVFSAPRPGSTISAEPPITTLAGLLFMLCGLGWMIPAQLSSQENLQLRNASVLLVTGGALVTLSQFHASWKRRVGIQPHVWLAANILAVVAIWLAVFFFIRYEPAGFAGGRTSWVLASLAATLGLTIVITTAAGSLSVASGHGAQAIEWRSGAGWCLTGGGFLVHGLVLIRDPHAHSAWWLPLLALGVLLVTGAPWTRNGSMQVSSPDIFRQQLHGHVLVGLTIIACISAAVCVTVLRNSPAATDWALISTSGFMLILSALTVCVSALKFQVRVSDLGRRVRLLSRMSQTDPLTGIANRRAIDDRLAAEIQRSARFGHALSIGLIDVDDFKRINDTYGHATGDLVLQRLASLLVRELRAIDVVGRYGGEEFLIILPETDAAGAAVAAVRILDAVRTDHHKYFAARRSITVSIGIAEFQSHGRSTVELLDAADTALYQAKREGKNRVVVSGSER